MADQGVAVDEHTSLFFLIIDAIAFWLRNQAVFWLLALPIAGLGAAGAYLVDNVRQFAFLHRPEAWHFLFALIYAMFLDRWIKESLLDDATPCDEVDALRHAIVPPPLLLFAIVFFLFSMVLSWVRLQGIDDSLARWHVPAALILPLGTLLAWLPHFLLWGTALAFVILLVPAWSAGAPLSLRQAWRIAAPVRPKLLRLLVGAVLLSMVVYAATRWGLEAESRKPWVPAAMAGIQHLVACLLLAVVGHVLAAVFLNLTDWQQPEPEERPFRKMRLRPLRRRAKSVYCERRRRRSS
jgi:hypothetical protein